MTGVIDELAAEAADLAAEGRAARRALKGAAGQIRLATQLLAAYETRLDAFTERLERIAEEAQHHEHDEAEAVAV